MQLRLQQTVEGLSIAAVSYYVIGIMGHGMAALQHLGAITDAEVATAATIPFVVASVGYVVIKRLRRHDRRAAQRN